MKDASTQQGAVARDSSRLGRAAAILVLGLGLVVTAAIWSSENRSIEVERQSVLLERANNVAAEVTQRLVAYELALRGAASLFAATETPSREQWRAYVEALALGRTYTSAQAIGYVAALSPESVRPVEVSMRENGLPNFRVWPSGPRSEASAVLYIEPLDAGNARALGYDMLTDPAARQAMQAARDSGAPVMSGPIALIQDAGRQSAAPAVLMYVPVYRPAVPGAEQPPRERQLLGWVFAPFRPADVLADVSRGELLAIRLFDENGGENRSLLYSDPAARFPPGAGSHEPTTLSMRFAGRAWRLEAQPTLAGSALLSARRPWEYLVGGILVSLLLFGITWSMATTRARANALALSMTETLRRTNEALDRRVNERTEELSRINERLRTEAGERELAERARGIALEQEAKRSSQLRALADAGLGLGLLPDNALRLEYLADVVCRIVGCAHSVIVLATDADRRSPLVASLEPLAAGKRRLMLEAVRAWPVSTETLLIEDPWCADRREDSALGAAAQADPEVLAVPIGIAQGGEIGMLYLVHGEGGRFSEEDRALVRQLTLLATAAIRNTQLAEEERRARLEAEAASLTKDQFLAIVSHELRTPLHAILGWLGVIERRGGGDSEKLAQALTVIRRNAEAQSMLIDDLLDLARIEQGKLQFDREPVELSQVVAAAVESHRTLAAERGISLHWAIAATGTVVGDDLRLQQAVSNLLGNALKFTPAGGRIEVRLRREHEHLVLEVADTGQGIAPEMLEHIFDRFRQADTSSKRRQGGLGLGLALVRHIVEMHGGTVSAMSDGAGRGATFIARIPAARIEDREPLHIDTAEADARAAAVEGGSAALGRMALGGRVAVNDERGSLGAPVIDRPPGDERTAAKPQPSRVMVVDDIADARDALTDLLDARGYSALDCDSANTALDWLESHPRSDWPIGVLCDIEMPGKDGFEFITALRELETRRGHDRPLPVVAVTAYGGLERRIRTREHGFASYLLKPVRPDRLLSLLASLSN